MMFNYGGVTLKLDGVNVTVYGEGGGTLKQAQAFANRMLEIVQFGRKLFDLLYTLASLPTPPLPPPLSADTEPAKAPQAAQERF
jgi:hypothetical protein